LKKIILSRTDNLGDVILTLPMTGVLKQHFPGIRIIFLGKAYTRPLIDACEHVDEFWDREELICSQQLAVGSRQSLSDIDAIIHVFPDKEICRLAKKAGIPQRISTSHRWYSWLYCNSRVHYSRKKSNLHEAQLNLKLLGPLGISKEYSLAEIGDLYGLTKVRRGTWDVNHPSSFKLILHPKSKGSAREWGLDNFSKLISLLPEDRFSIYVTGTKEEGVLMRDFLAKNSSRITNLTGKLTLPELISFINSCDGLVAASTGPLHIAAALGKRAIGLYAPMRPIFPQRWSPVGKNAEFLVLDKKCEACRKTMDCECIRSILPKDVAKKLI
jgi:heptosyltransferase III